MHTTAIPAATIRLRGIDIRHEVLGSGPPLVLVHGSWSDLTTWDAVAGPLADEFRVVRYDRRGHTGTTRPPGPRSRRDDEDDLAALIEALDCAPAHVAGNSFGGLVALGLAARRPDLVRAVAVHEPPAVAACPTPEGTVAWARLAEVLRELDTGAVATGTRRFVEEVALGPGTWELLPEALRAAMIGNAPAFRAEQRDPDCTRLDLAALRSLGARVLVTRGDASPPWLQAVARELGYGHPDARAHVLGGAGHAPQLTHPGEYVELLRAWAGLS